MAPSTATDMVDITIKTADGQTHTLHTTQHHPFWDATHKKWVDAATLRPGSRLLAPDASKARVTRIGSFSAVRVMYNLTVADLDTYYALAGKAPVLVHNCGEDIYVAGGKHGRTARSTSRGTNSAEPKNGQTVLDNSVQVKGTSPRRVGIDKDNGEIVVLDRTRQDPCGCKSPDGENSIWHGHVRKWEELHPDQQRRCVRAALSIVKETFLTEQRQPDGAWRTAMLAAVHSGSLAKATDALLALTYDDPDRAWIEQILLGVIADQDIDVQVRSLAITCLGHLARIHEEISLQVVLPVLRDLMQSSVFGGIAQDAMDDIDTYVLRSKP